MRLAWFSPLPPVRSGIAALSAELVPVLQREFDVDCFPEASAHDFIWRHRRVPYDLAVYHLGNAPFHDYMWAYLAAFPGLVVLHDPRLHQARARQLLGLQRFDDYRHEFWFDHPEAPRDFVEYAIEGLGGPIYYLWPMVRVVVQTARLVAVHNERVAEGLRASFPDAIVRSIPLGKTGAGTHASGIGGIDGNIRRDLRTRLGIPDDAIVFAVFGKLTAEKRITPIFQAFAATVVRDGVNAWLLLVGDSTEYPALAATIARLPAGDRVRATGHVADDAIPGYLTAADVCLCLRWPTALETSAAWLHCLAARRATVISDLAHLVDIPTAAPRTLETMGPAAARRDQPRAVAVRIDLLNETEELGAAMRVLARDSALRDALADAGYQYWAAHHTIEVAAAGYRRVIQEAAGRIAPAVADLPRHFTRDYSELASRIAGKYGVAQRLPFLACSAPIAGQQAGEKSQPSALN
jgi:glycosyltransferase involved in cell wall biosynthesis